MSSQVANKCDSSCPYNQYNTDYVKLDANNFHEVDGGERMVRAEPEALISSQFALLISSGNSSSGSQSDAPLERAQSKKMAKQAILSAVEPDSISNKSFTDVTFVVGPPQHSKKYVGHRVLLAMTSPVFEAMFYGDMADKNKYIRVPDVAPIGFENLLRFAYTDSLKLNSVEDAMLTAYAAKKYLLPQLLRECLTFIEQTISPSTACVVFEFAQVLNSQQLVLQAMNILDRQTSVVICKKSFNSAQPSTVEFLANRKYLNLGDSECSLAEAVIGWAQAEAKRRQVNPNDWLAIRRMLASENSILKAFRFLAMSQEEFANLILRSSAGSRSQALGAKASSSGGAADSTTGELRNQSPPNDGFSGLDLENPNSLLNELEQRAIFMNLAIEGSAKMPANLSATKECRAPPPDHFTMRRLGKLASGNMISTIMTSTRNIDTISSKFQCLSENIFIVGLTIPIRLDSSSYINRTPKFECHLKFVTRSQSTSGQQKQTITSSSPIAGLANGGAGQGADSQQQANDDPTSTMLMDSIDESLHISISKDKDCFMRLKRPILVRIGNINEIAITFQTYALDEDVALKTPKFRSSSFSEQLDDEGISWLFLKTSGIEFSEIHYYY